MRKIHSAILLLSLVLQASNNAPNTQYFRYQRQVLNPSNAGGQTCFALPPELFAHASPTLADLRLYRDATEIPFDLHVAYSMDGGSLNIPPANLGQRDGDTVFDALVPQPSIRSSGQAGYSDLELAIDAKNFLATVDVSGSNSGILTTSLGSFTIFDLTGQKLGRSTILHLPPSNFPTLHFRVHGPIPPSAVTGITVDRLPTSEPRYIPLATTAKITQQGHKTLLEFTIPANTPVNRIVFLPGATPETFSRDVSVTAEAINPPNENLRAPTNPLRVAGSLLRVHRDEDGHRIDEEHLILDTDGSILNLARKWVITIDNGDDAPITLDSVRLEMLERHLCYESAANSTATLYYGDPGRNVASYDYQRLFVAKIHPISATLGPEQWNASFQPRPDTRAFTEKHPALLWIALIAIIALLGGIALGTARRASQPPQ